MTPNEDTGERPEDRIEVERLVQLAVDRDAVVTESERREFELDDALAAQVDELGAFVEKQRALCEFAISDEVDASRARDLTERILRSTTKRNPSRAGDFRLISNWLISHCRQSVWVRLAAASLLLHLAALPILAWYLLSEPEPEPRIFFAPPVAQEFEPQPAESIEVDALDAQLLLNEEPIGKIAPFMVLNARRRARFVLQSHGAPIAKGLLPGALTSQLLLARSQGINDNDWSLLSELKSKQEQPLELALLAEAWLDRSVMEEGGTAPNESLRKALSALHPSLNGSSAVDRLVRSAASRALELGFTDEALRAGWKTDLWYQSDGASHSELGGRPLTAEWFANLKQATEAQGNDPVLGAWLDWSVR